MSMLVLWKADDGEEGSQRIAGRPAQAFWRRLRPSFRGVLLEPHRRAGDGRVGWSWTGPAEPLVPGSADLASLRKRLGAGLANLAAELERDEETGGVESAALHEGMESLIAGLTGAPDAELAAFAVRTETGWMIRSWGISRPAAARRADGVENEPPAEPESVPGAAVHEPVPALPAAAPAKHSSPRRRIVSWLVGGLVVLALVALAFRALRHKPAQDPVAKAGQEAVAVFPPAASASPVGGASPEAARVGPESLSLERARPVVPRIFSPQAAASLRGREPAASEMRGKVVPVPIAYTGPIGSPPEDEPRPLEVGPDSGRGGKADPSPDSAGRGDQAPEGSQERGHAGFAEPSSGSAGSDGAAQDALERTSGDRPIVLGEPVDRAGEPVRRDRPRSDSLGDIPTAPSAGVRMPPDAPADAASSVARIGAEPGPAAAARVKNKLVERDGPALPKPAVKAPPKAVRSPRLWSCRFGEWRLARTRDVALSTVPLEVAAEGDAGEVLAAARRRAWEQVRAALPRPLHQPVTRAGWVFIFTKAASRGGAPVWRIEKGGGQGVLALAGPSRAELGWAEPVAAGLVARLLGPAGVEWASIRVEEGGRTMVVRAGPELAETAPWFEVRGTGGDPSGGTSFEGGWRSLRPGWLDTRWQQDQGGEAARVSCFAADPLAALPVEGVVALEHPPSGWALAREVWLTPGQ